MKRAFGGVPPRALQVVPLNFTGTLDGLLSKVMTRRPKNVSKLTLSVWVMAMLLVTSTKVPFPVSAQTLPSAMTTVR